MTTVVDASVLVAALVYSGDAGVWAETLISQGALACPELAMVEATNVLRRLESSGQISSSRATAAHGVLLQSDLELFPFSPFARRIWSLRHNLTCYDAWYVALAEALDCPLATLDRRLSRANGPTCEFIVPALSDHAGN